MSQQREKRPTTRDRVRQIAVIAAMVMAISGATFGSGAFGGVPIQDAAGGAFASDATILAPAGPAFAIWSVIYLGLVAYAVYQALPRQAVRRLHRAVGWWVAASMVLNGAWILIVQAGLVALSLVTIVVLLVVLVIAFVLLRTRRALRWTDAVFVHGVIGLYLGWVMVATVANTAVALVQAGVDPSAATADAWGVAVLGVVGAITIALAIWDRGRLAPAIATAWGVFWIGIARTGGDPASPMTAVTAFVVAGAIVLCTVVVRVVVIVRRRSAPASAM